MGAEGRGGVPVGVRGRVVVAGRQLGKGGGNVAKRASKRHVRAKCAATGWGQGVQKVWVVGGGVVGNQKVER